MSPDKEKKLVEAFPSLFRDINKSPQESCMVFGCECGDGWFNLIWETCERLEQAKQTERVDVYFCQVKEKWGRLTIYLNNYQDKYEKIIDDAEKHSAYVCEECGDTKFAKLRYDGWARCLCNKCEEARRSIQLAEWDKINKNIRN